MRRPRWENGLLSSQASGHTVQGRLSSLEQMTVDDSGSFSMSHDSFLVLAGLNSALISGTGCLKASYKMRDPQTKVLGVRPGLLVVPELELLVMPGLGSSSRHSKAGGDRCACHILSILLVTATTHSLVTVEVRIEPSQSDPV